MNITYTDKSENRKQLIKKQKQKNRTFYQEISLTFLPIYDQL